ncbi:MAG: DEAD/DEAH box helicase [Microthrixaceae bacterium]
MSCRSSAASRSGDSCSRSNEGSTWWWRHPGRAMDHLRRGTLATHRLATVVLDEADEMLDMGFAEDIETILAETPAVPTDRAVLGDHARPDRQARQGVT